MIFEIVLCIALSLIFAVLAMINDKVVKLEDRIILTGYLMTMIRQDMASLVKASEQQDDAEQEASESTD